MQLATQIRDAMRDAKNGGVKGYDRALTLGRDAIRERQAIITGRRMLTQNVTLEDVKDVLRGAPDAVRAGMRKGLRQNIENIMDNARVAVADLEGSYDFATGQDAAKSALAAMQNMLKPANVKKMRALLGDEADTLMKEMQRMSATVTLKAAVARGSQTAIRTAGREAIQENAQGGLLRRSLGKSGGLTSATQELTEAAAGVDPNTVRQMVASDAAEIVRVLTQIRGDDARRALIAVRRSMRGQPVRDEEALLIGRLVGIGSAAGTSQSDLQLIGR